MQEGAAHKVQRMVIGRTTRGRLMIKVFNECLKLHLLTSFISANLLTCGFFEVIFFDEEGAKSTRKIIAVEWNGMNFSFSKYISNFDANTQ